MNNFGMRMFDDDEPRRPGESGFTAGLRKASELDAFFQNSMANDPPPAYSRAMRAPQRINPFEEIAGDISKFDGSLPKPMESAPSAKPVSQAFKLAGAFGGSIPFAAAHAVGSGANALSSFFQNRERLSFARESRDKDFAAAERVGLSHPSQFNSISGQLGKYKGNLISPIQRTIGSSPYSF